MKHKRKELFRFTRGQMLIELILAIGIATIFLPALITGLVASREGKAQQSQRLQAVTLLKEAENVVRAVKNNGWTNFASLTSGSSYHPEISGDLWILAGGIETLNGFTRQIVLSDVYRDTNGAIVSSGGTLDSSTKRVDITIGWLTPYPSQITSTMYVTRNTNMTYSETTQAQFSAGDKTGVVITNDTDGEVVLASGGGSDWCAPSLTIAALDLPKNGVANAINAIEGRVFAGTGENASGVSYANVNISNANPPVASIIGTFDGYKTNDVFGEMNYAYLATDNNSKEIEIINLTTNPLTEAGSFNAPGNSSGNSVYVTNNYGYMTSGNKLYNFRKIGSNATIDSDGVTLAGTGNKIVVVGNYAYVATSSTSNQLQIVDISNPASLSIVQSITVPGQGAISLFVNSSATRAYLVTDISSTQREFFIIDIVSSSPTYGQVKGSYEANGMSPKGVTVVTNNKAIIVGTSGEEYQVINIGNEANPSRCGGINIDTGINGVSSVVEGDGDAFSYIITGDATSELKIIEGGPGGQYSTSGIFESAPFDAGLSVAFNRFVANVLSPAATDMRMQVSVAPAVSGSCNGASYTYLGPNGSASSYFTPNNNTITGIIPWGSYSPTYQNPSRCFRYKVWLSTTDQTQTPILEDIIWNYSP